jgi:hypothetical protein
LADGAGQGNSRAPLGDVLNRMTDLVGNDVVPMDPFKSVLKPNVTLWTIYSRFREVRTKSSPRERAARNRLKRAANESLSDCDHVFGLQRLIQSGCASSSGDKRRRKRRAFNAFSESSCVIRRHSLRIVRLNRAGGDIFDPPHMTCNRRPCFKQVSGVSGARIPYGLRNHVVSVGQGVDQGLSRLTDFFRPARNRAEAIQGLIVYRNRRRGARMASGVAYKARGRA